MSKAGDDQFPSVAVPGALHESAVGWDKIVTELKRGMTRSRTEKLILVVECYPGVDELAVLNELQSRLTPALTIRAADSYHPPEKIDALVAPFLRRGDPLERFGPNHSRRLSLVNFFDAEPLWRFRRTIDELKGGLVLIVGCGASLIAWGHLLVYAGLARREARERFYRKETGNLSADNKSAAANLKCERASLVDWPVIDRWKRPLIKRWDYVLDTNRPDEPKLADAADVRRGLQAAVRRPFRVVASREAHRESEALAGRLDFNLEESSLLLGLGELRFEVPAVDLLFYQSRALLGEAVQRRLGPECPAFFRSLASVGCTCEALARGDGWREERVGLDERAWVEIRRHWFKKTVAHDTGGGIHILNLIEGEEAMVESPERAFEPCVVHRGETFIIPAAVGRYHIRPHGSSVGKEIATLKAFVRI